MKPKISYICTSCQYKNPAWAGQCPQCGEWNTMQEQVEEAQTKRTTGLKSAPTRTTSINAFEKSENRRIKTGIEELDRTIGGGFLQSSFTLLTGEPGIGKSTLTLQIAHAIANQNKKVLIISGEESEYQLQERAHRLNTTNKNIQIANESRLETIIATTELEKPEFLIIDSIQVVGTDMIPSTPGSITQVRFCTEELLGYCKKNSITTIIIGHVTKDGLLAGPKTLEHL
ncbi:MAG: ATPase domain-containing protein, partial [Candidatus Gracilibacteria bacterium]